MARLPPSSNRPVDRAAHPFKTVHHVPEHLSTLSPVQTHRGRGRGATRRVGRVRVAPPETSLCEKTLTRLASLATLSRSAGEGLLACQHRSISLFGSSR